MHIVADPLRGVPPSPGAGLETSSGRSPLALVTNSSSSLLTIPEKQPMKPPLTKVCAVVMAFSPHLPDCVQTCKLYPIVIVAQVGNDG